MSATSSIHKTLVKFLNSFCLQAQSVDGPLVLQIEEILGMDNTVPIEVKNISERVGDDLERPRDTSENPKLISYLNVMRYNGKQSNKSNILINS